MEEITKFWDNIGKMVKDTDNTVLSGTVNTVNEKERTCTVKIGNVIYEDVRLYGVVKAGLKGHCFIPKIGSAVILGRIDGSNEMFVMMFTEIDKLMLTIGEKTQLTVDEWQTVYQNDKTTLAITGNKVELTADEIVFNGGTFEGLVKIGALTTKINELVDTFNDHTHPGVITAVKGGSGAPAVGTPGSTEKTAPASKLKQSDYENLKVKH